MSTGVDSEKIYKVWNGKVMEWMVKQAIIQPLKGGNGEGNPLLGEILTIQCFLHAADKI